MGIMGGAAAPAPPDLRYMSVPLDGSGARWVIGPPSLKAMADKAGAPGWTPVPPGGLLMRGAFVDARGGRAPGQRRRPPGEKW